LKHKEVCFLQASGIAASNLVEWNALTLALDAPGPQGEAILIDYVHIRAHSALVPPGTVRKRLFRAVLMRKRLFRAVLML
jgi:hypothetical protein